jgi:hypothetical protein
MYDTTQSTPNVYHHHHHHHHHHHCCRCRCGGCRYDGATLFAVPLFLFLFLRTLDQTTPKVRNTCSQGNNVNKHSMSSQIFLDCNTQGSARACKEVQESRRKQKEVEAITSTKQVQNKCKYNTSTTQVQNKYKYNTRTCRFHFSSAS